MSLNDQESTSEESIYDDDGQYTAQDYNEMTEYLNAMTSLIYVWVVSSEAFQEYDSEEDPYYYNNTTQSPSIEDKTE